MNRVRKLWATYIKCCCVKMIKKEIKIISKSLSNACWFWKLYANSKQLDHSWTWNLCFWILITMLKFKKNRSITWLLYFRDSCTTVYIISLTPTIKLQKIVHQYVCILLKYFSNETLNLRPRHLFYVCVSDISDLNLIHCNLDRFNWVSFHLYIFCCWICKSK